MDMANGDDFHISQAGNFQLCPEGRILNRKAAKLNYGQESMTSD